MVGDVDDVCEVDGWMVVEVVDVLVVGVVVVGCDVLVVVDVV